MGESRRQIRVFPDWGHPWPLWESEAGPNMWPADYGLSVALTRLMRDWYDLWEAHCDPFEGWDSSDAERRFRELGGAVISLLRLEVANVADVIDLTGSSDATTASAESAADGACD